MKNVKDILTAVFFLVCFTGCIATNCVRNVKILMQSAKVKQKESSAPVSIRANAAASVYFLMDKKENETQKYPSPRLFVSESTSRNTYQSIRYFEVSIRSGKPRPIYVEVHNYRI